MTSHPSQISYLARLRSKIPPTASGRYCTAHRIFLACLILSSKFVNDLSPKNRKWAIYSQTENFSLDIMEVNLMERQLLSLLKWKLLITLPKLQFHFEPFLRQIWYSTSLPIPLDIKPRTKPRRRIPRESVSSTEQTKATRSSRTRVVKQGKTITKAPVAAPERQCFGRLTETEAGCPERNSPHDYPRRCQLGYRDVIRNR